MKLEKPWYQMTAEEREAIRTQRRIENGGAECAQCGKEDHEDNLVAAGDKVYCEECAGGGPLLTQAEADALDKQ